MTETKSSEKVTKESLLAEYKRVEGPAQAEGSETSPKWDELVHARALLAEYKRKLALLDE